MTPARGNTSKFRGRPVAPSPNTGIHPDHVPTGRRTPVEAANLRVDTRSPCQPTIAPGNDPSSSAPPQGDVAFKRETGEPLTPKSAYPKTHDEDPSLQGSKTTYATLNATAAHDMAAVDELLYTMKRMLGSLGSTFDTLGAQTIRVATLPIAIKAIHDIDELRGEVKAHEEAQDARVTELRTKLGQDIESRLHRGLRDVASGIVKEAISREIAARVRKELARQISQETRDEVVAFKAKITDLKIRLHNSEARRVNAMLRSDSPTEPFQPLLRPLQASTVPSTAADPSGHRFSSSSTTPLTIPSESVGKTPRSKDVAPAISNGAERFPTSTPEPIPPTPSCLFPQDLTSLVRLSPEETISLMREYGLEVPATGQGDCDFSTRGMKRAPTKKATEGTEREGDREHTLNTFLSFIGVPFKLVPVTPTTPGKSNLHPPLIINGPE